MDVRGRTIPREPDPVRRRTPARINARIDNRIARRVEDCASKSRTEMSCDINDLDDELDVEHAFVLAGGLVALPGIVLGAAGRRGWLVLPAAVALFGIQFGLQGWCAPIALLRRRGFRTRREIDGEKYAIKSLRGDFEAVSSTSSVVARAGSAVQAVSH
jgi:hypothetical protein